MTGALSLSRPFRKLSSRINRYPTRFPPNCSTRFPAAAAEPPRKMLAQGRRHGEVSLLLTSSNNIINHQYVLPLLHGITLDLKEVLTILLLESSL
jgi:hypothetical protein